MYAAIRRSTSPPCTLSWTMAAIATSHSTPASCLTLGPEAMPTGPCFAKASTRAASQRWQRIRDGHSKKTCHTNPGGSSTRRSSAKSPSHSPSRASAATSRSDTCNLTPRRWGNSGSRSCRRPALCSGELVPWLRRAPTLTIRLSSRGCTKASSARVSGSSRSRGWRGRSARLCSCPPAEGGLHDVIGDEQPRGSDESERST
mmetsp:Transcript_60927/g.157071  ORF Transcript_60927/g.157071 Transcript_60927/m.157071 type:complete len:202 (+) Transcript_60927:52-657(+)